MDYLNAEIKKNICLVSKRFSKNKFFRGLCGILNNKPDDDFTDLKGRQAIRSDLFATSWATQTDCPNDSKSISRGKCASSAEVEEAARRKCQKLFVKPFR